MSIKKFILCVALAPIALVGCGHSSDPAAAKKSTVANSFSATSHRPEDATPDPTPATPVAAEVPAAPIDPPPPGSPSFGPDPQAQATAAQQDELRNKLWAEKLKQRALLKQQQAAQAAQAQASGNGAQH